MRRCFSKEPAAPLVVPRAERKMEGWGEMEDSFGDHWEWLASVRGWNLVVSVVGGARCAAGE
jgi:hypothetical protein